MVEFIKDVRFRRNLVDFNGVSKWEVHQLADKLDGKKKGYSPEVKKPNLEIEDKPVDLNYDFFFKHQAIKLLTMPYLQRAKEVHQVLEIIQWTKDFALEQR